MLQQSWSNPSSLWHRQEKQWGNVSDTWRLDCVDILLLLKKHQSGYRRQRLACSNVHNNRNHGRVWTWGWFFLTGERLGGLACWSKMRVCQYVLEQAEKNDVCLHATWTQRTWKPVNQHSHVLQRYEPQRKVWILSFKPASQCWGSECSLHQNTFLHVIMNSC